MGLPRGTGYASGYPVVGHLYTHVGGVGMRCVCVSVRCVCVSDGKEKEGKGERVYACVCVCARAITWVGTDTPSHDDIVTPYSHRNMLTPVEVSLITQGFSPHETRGVHNIQERQTPRSSQPPTPPILSRRLHPPFAIAIATGTQSRRALCRGTAQRGPSECGDTSVYQSQVSCCEIYIMCYMYCIR